MNIQLIAEQIGRIHLSLETQDAFEVYGGTWLGAFEVCQTGTAQWTLTVRDQVVAAAPLRDYKVYARQLATGREWEVLSGKILVSARTAAVPADKLAPVEYFVTVPVVDHDVDAVGSTIVQGIPGPQGPKGDKGEPGEGGMTEAERDKLAGAAQRDADNTFTAANTFTGSVDMSTAQVTPPEGWNVGELTAEEVQAVVPIAWRGSSCYFGTNSEEGGNGVAIGFNTRIKQYSVSIGSVSSCFGARAVAIGNSTTAQAYNVVIGENAAGNKSTTVTIGARFGETVDGTFVAHTCTTEGKGSITIGAGANTLNTTKTDGTIVESSNSVTIGCKAENKGADSVVIGATATTAGSGNVIIGAASTSGEDTWIKESVAIGKGARVIGSRSVAICGGANGNSTVAICGSAAGSGSIAIGGVSKSAAGNSIAIGNYETITSSPYTVAVGNGAKAANYGATVIRSTAEDGTITQLYFSGANTPLANTYHGGAPMLGYVTKDAAGNIVAAGTRSLIDLLTDNSTFAPASLDENGEWVMPKVFHPSDLDLPSEEPAEPEEYQPLPVWPIVEPEDLPPHGEVEKS